MKKSKMFWALSGAPTAMALTLSMPAHAAGQTQAQSAETTSQNGPQTTPPVGGAATPAEATASGGNTSPDIIVTGIRGSLQRDLDIKRNASGVVDAISAEDIGKFPDSNVASALQRLPGVAIQRSGQRGDATGVSIRGFGGDFVDTLYDGRHISTAAGGRGVDFSTVGSDFVGRLSVYKTPDVELSTSAIGGTIDISFPKPFDHPGFRLAVSGSGSIQDRSKDVVPTGGLLVSDTFAGDTLGILADVAYTRHDTTSNHVFIPGWVGQGNIQAPGLYTCQLTPSCVDANGNSLQTTRTGVAQWVPQQQGIDQSYTKDERVDARMAVQWHPAQNVMVTLDDNYSRQTIHSTDYGYAAWFNGADIRNAKVDSNGTVTDFTQFGTPMDFNANVAKTVQETNQFGANLKWDIVDGLTFDLDGAVARSTRNPNHDGYSDSMDIGYGGTNGQNGTIETASTVLGAPTGVTILGNSANYYPQIHGIGPNGNVSNFTNQSFIGSHDIVRGAPYNTDTVKQIRGSIGWNKDGLQVKLGGQYYEDRLYGEDTSTFTNGVFASRGGYGTCSGRVGGSAGGICPLPANVYQGTIGTNNFIPGYSGTLGPAILVYNPYAVYSLLESTGGSVAPTLDPGSIYQVTEKTYAIFFKTSYDTTIGSMPFHFAAGIRDEGTNETSTALGRNVLGLSIPANDPTLIQPNPALGPLKDGYSATTTILGKQNYNYLLPSLDAKLDVMKNLILRLDASRTLTRPGLSSLKPTITLGTLRVGSLSASGGNPALLPYLSDNFDAAAEWYYQRNSYFSVDFYLKHISNFIVGGVSQTAINNVVDPSTGKTAIFNLSLPVNGPEATVKGVEIALQQVFGNSGFGFQANATLPSTNKNYNPADISGSAFSITGLAKSANFVGFYDKHGLQARVAVNWRDTYLSALGQGQGGTYGAEPVFIDAQVQVDASASYDINKQFTVFVEGTNLNNSDYSSHGRFSNQVLDIYSYGRRFTFGARFHY